MSASRRTERVATMIRDELSSLLLRDVSDPRLANVMFTEVEVSKDLHLAWVYYDTRDGEKLSDKKRAEIEKGLKSASSFFRRKMGDVMASKFTPELRFKQDTHTTEVTHLMNLIDQVKTPSALTIQE
jgi:ribosome-binding factor A